MRGARNRRSVQETKQENSQDDGKKQSPVRPTHQAWRAKSPYWCVPDDSGRDFYKEMKALEYLHILRGELENGRIGVDLVTNLQKSKEKEKENPKYRKRHLFQLNKVM